MLKVSRSMKETAGKGYAAREQLERKLGREPSLMEIADEIGVTPEELAMAMESGAEIESLQKTIYQGDGNDISLMDKLEEKTNQNEKLLDRILLENLLKILEPDERKLIYLRYFQEETQVSIAKKMGISQVQVSRMEKKILERLRKNLM